MSTSKTLDNLRETDTMAASENGRDSVDDLIADIGKTRDNHERFSEVRAAARKRNAERRAFAEEQFETFSNPHELMESLVPNKA